MARREFYTTVDLGGRALVVRSRIGGGFTKVADCRTPASAQRLVDELNEVRCVHVNVIHEAIRLLGTATNKSIAQATPLLRDAAGPEEDEDKTCRHGAVTKYFDRCLCPGCLADAVERTRVADMVAQLKRAAEQALEKEAPERRQWRFEHFMKPLGGM